MEANAARILVVDDAPLIRGMLVTILKKNGYRVDTANNGQEAVQHVTRKQPDLILMDADMPVLDGIAACAQIRALPDIISLPIIMVTSFVEREWVDRAYAAGATDYITKPVNWDVLRNRIHYILQAKRAEEALLDEKEKAEVTLASIGDGVITTDANGQVEYLNPVASNLTGWSTDAAKGLALNEMLDLYSETDGSKIIFPLELFLQQGQRAALNRNNHTVLRHRNGQQQFAIEHTVAPICDRENNIIGVVLVFHDVTANREMTRQLTYKAEHDALTGLYNRHKFNQVLYTPPAHNVQDILLYLDLDQFKIVNDTCGHEAGDQLLKDIALLLEQQVAIATDLYQHAVLARLGGDEFGLLLRNSDLDKATQLADAIRLSIERFKFYWQTEQDDKNVFAVGVSIGLVSLRNNIHPKSLLAMADAACYAAKNSGRNNIHVYTDHDEQLLSRHQDIEWVNLLNNNLDKHDGFSLFQQPIQSLQGNAIVPHYEILLRMCDPDGHLLPPGAFLSAAARYNLMPTLDRWVVQALFNWWQQHHKTHAISLHINISGYSLGDKNFLPQLQQFLHERADFARQICFEIAETTAITNLSGTLEFITTLRPLGCRFAIDDFGTGIGAFTHLRILEIDFLKIDGSLIRQLTQDKVDLALVQAMQNIAQLLQIHTIAENVENQATVEVLHHVGVDYMQGYFVQPPKPLSMLEASV